MPSDIAQTEQIVTEVNDRHLCGKPAKSLSSRQTKNQPQGKISIGVISFEAHISEINLKKPTTLPELIKLVLGGGGGGY